jgi:hypothetical protein
MAQVEAVKTEDDFRALNSSLRGRVAAAAAWAPNPDNFPLYLDLPVRNGQLDPEVMNKFAANQPPTGSHYGLPNQSARIVQCHHKR